MGREAECRARFDGQEGEGKALLEGDALFFRGPFKLRIERSDVKTVEARSGWLLVKAGRSTLALHLGPAAEVWADDLLNPRSRADKLGVKAGQKVTVLGVTDAQLVPELEARGADVSTRLRKETDVVFVQIDAATELARLSELASAIARDGAVWTVTPRGAPGLKDTDVMAAAKKAGLVDVKVVRFNETHSANKFMVPKATRTRSSTS